MASDGKTMITVESGSVRVNWNGVRPEVARLYAVYVA